MKKKVLIIIPLTGEGGIEKLIIDWIKMLDSNFDFMILALNPGNNAEFDNLNVPIYFINSNKNLLATLIKIRSFFQINRNFDAIHSHVSYLNGPISLIAKSYGNNNIISHAHLNNRNPFTNIFTTLIYPSIYLFFKFLIKCNCNYKVACSYHAGKFLYGTSPFITLKNAIKVGDYQFDIDYREKTRKKYNINGPVIMHVGRFSGEKNHEFLIDIFYRLYSIDETYHLFLFGEGELKNHIIEKVKSLNLTKSVHFMGYKPDVQKFFSVADIFLLPSILEGFPVVLVEAQTSGIDIIASENIPIEVKITNLIEFLPLSDLDSWIKSIIDLKSNKIEKRSQYVEVVRNKGFDIESEARLLARLYSKTE